MPERHQLLGIVVLPLDRIGMHQPEDLAVRGLGAARRESRHRHVIVVGPPVASRPISIDALRYAGRFLEAGQQGCQLFAIERPGDEAWIQLPTPFPGFPTEPGGNLALPPLLLRRRQRVIEKGDPASIMIGEDGTMYGAADPRRSTSSAMGL